MIAKKTKKSEKKSLPAILCKGCGTKFIPDTHKQRFHSEICREEYYSRTYFKREVTQKICPNCGTNFPTSKPGRQIYCCPDCRVEAAQKRKDNLTVGIQEQRKQFYTDRYRQMEADGFACRLCGKEVRDGVKLEVEPGGRGGYMTVCNICSEGKKNKR